MLGKIVIFLLLLGMFFLKFPFIIILGLSIAFLSFLLLLLYKRCIDKIGMLVIINYIYWLYSGFLSKGIALKDFVNPNFISGDGRIFLYYIPLLFFSVYSVNVSTLYFLKKLLEILALSFFVIFAIWFLFKPYFFYTEKDFTGFLTSHTGAGAFLGSILVFFFIYGFSIKSKKYLLLFVLILIPFIFTSSRGALFGVICVFIWFFWGKLDLPIYKKSAYLFLIISFLTILIIVNQRAYERIVILFSTNFFLDARDLIEFAINWQPYDLKSFSNLAVREIIYGPYTEAIANVFARFLFYVYAIKTFLISPLIGIGFGRYNDLNIHFTGIKYFVYLATNGDKILLEKTAHNSYLHFLSELGVVGIVLILSLWCAIYKRLSQIIRRVPGEKYLAAFLLACQGLIVFTLVSSFYGHALAAPSIGIIVLTIIGLAISFSRNRIKRDNTRLTNQV